MKSNGLRYQEWLSRRWLYESAGYRPPLPIIRCTPRLRDKQWVRDNVDATTALLGTWFLLAAAGWILLRV